MTNDSTIPPLLSAEQWSVVLDILDGSRRPRKELAHNSPVERARLSIGHRRREDAYPLWIALYNASLPDGDQRKITRAGVNALAAALRADWVGDEEATACLRALESYLPPEAVERERLARLAG